MGEPMPDLITILGGAVLGWLLKTVADKWTWRRQQVLDAYLGMLDAVDLFGPLAGRLWGLVVAAPRLNLTERDLTERSERAQQGLIAIDRAHGKLVLVAGARGASLAFDLYVACEVMFRRAVALPPSTAERYTEASMQMVKTYHDLVDEGRREMGLKHWRERMPGQVARFDLMKRRLAELNRTDPFPPGTDPAAQPREPKPPSESSAS
jgi:hypothetical protein